MNYTKKQWKQIKEEQKLIDRLRKERNSFEMTVDRWKEVIHTLGKTVTTHPLVVLYKRIHESKIYEAKFRRFEFFGSPNEPVDTNISYLDLDPFLNEPHGYFELEWIVLNKEVEDFECLSGKLNKWTIDLNLIYESLGSLGFVEMDFNDDNIKIYAFK